ncbi:MAG: aldehyde ferredoxin oxidoreductase family protein [Spirochaetota bacterium]|nr:MAG: aldehyde ferredoxin oxidoreductase family protein [Spirochaetota bacterium]
MAHGFCGRMLRVDLTNRETSMEELSGDLFRDYIGGRGINARYLLEELPQNVDPYAPENILLISAGSLSGTIAPASSRLTVSSKSPETMFYCKTTSGGHFAPELKLAGYDGIIVTGAADDPVYLYINDDRVEIREARHLWGQDVRETDRMLKEELGDPKISCLCIGPAGENLIRYAAVMVNIYRCASRCGMGGVMGSKGLKAIAVRGTGSLKVKDPDRFKTVAYEARVSSKEDQDRWYRYFLHGTQRGLVWANEAGFNPTRNFQTGYIEDAYRVGGEYIRERYQMRETGCGSCVINCGTYYEMDESPFGSAFSEGPEWETCNSFGARIGSVDTKFLLKANEFANINGLDISSLGNIVGFVLELYEKGIITKKDTDGLDLSWGSTGDIMALFKKIVKREGFGKLIGESITTIAETIGKNAIDYAIHVKGLGLTSCDSRLTKAYALAFAVNPRGGDHLHTEIICQFGATPEHVDIAKRVSGSPEGAKPLSTEGKAKMTKYHEDYVCVSDSLGICFFHSLSSHHVTPDMMAELFESATGIPMSVEQLESAGERILAMERIFNIREGLTREDDTLPRRMFEEEIPDGPSKGLTITREELESMLVEYYTLHGWDPETGVPLEKTLKALSIDSYSKYL